MANHLLAFFIFLVGSIPTLVFFRPAFAGIIGDERFVLWRNIWLAYMVSTFVLMDFWFFIVGSSVLLLALSPAEREKPALFLLLGACASGFAKSIPGFGIISYVFNMTPQLALIFVIMVPAMLVSARMKKQSSAAAIPEALFIGWLLFTVILSIRSPSITDILRNMFLTFVATGPIYFVMSRWPRSLDDVRLLSVAIVMPLVVLAVLTAPEFITSWHYFISVSNNWHGYMPFTYSYRGGFLRSSAAVFNPIIWGFILSAGIGIGLAVFNEKSVSKFHRTLAFAVLAGALVMTVSRGPWIGAIATVGMFALTSPQAPTRVFQLGALGGIGVLLALMTPFGANMLSFLPFIGTSGTNTIEYRQDLFSVSVSVILQNPFFGDPNFIDNPDLAVMRQGQGIIDIVNSYIGIGLQYGLIGLGLFVGFFASLLLSLWGAARSAHTYNPMLAVYCRAYLASIVGMLLIIVTASSIEHVPMYYWAIGGIGIALVRIEKRERQKAASGVLEEEPTPEEAAPKKEEFAWR